MQQYSLVVWSSKGVAIPDPLILLGEGINAVNLFTEDIEGAVALLKEEGCEVRSVNALMAEPTTPADLYLPGEEQALLEKSEI